MTRKKTRTAEASAADDERTEPAPEAGEIPDEGEAPEAPQDPQDPGSESASAEAARAEADPGADPPTGVAQDEAAEGRHAFPEQDEERTAEAELSGQLDALQSEFQGLNDRHLRLAAEFQNYRRRAETEMRESWTRAQADFARRFLEVLDDLQRVSGLDPADEAVSVESIVEGVDLVERKFLRALEDAGVDVLDPAGEPFDPESMEAMMRVPAESEEDDDLVDQVFQKGYRLGGHLIRPARVSVRKHE